MVSVFPDLPPIGFTCPLSVDDKFVQARGSAIYFSLIVEVLVVGLHFDWLPTCPGACDLDYTTLTGDNLGVTNNHFKFGCSLYFLCAYAVLLVKGPGFCYVDVVLVVLVESLERAHRGVDKTQQHSDRELLFHAVHFSVRLVVVSQLVCDIHWSSWLYVNSPFPAFQEGVRQSS